MRRPARLLLAGAVVAGGLAVATPASAYCDPLFYAVTGRCGNACGLVARGYYTAYQAAPGVVPYVEILCPA